MAAPSIGGVVLVRFPFSDLSSSKRRPAVVLAAAGRDDYVLCQVTGNRYADLQAIEIKDSDFVRGSITRTSYVRPSKLFTANGSLIAREVGRLDRKVRSRIVEEVYRLLREGLDSS